MTENGFRPVAATPNPDALLVNVADNLEILTNGKYKSIEHRAGATTTKARMSSASFFSPPHDVEIEPLEHIVQETPGSVKKYKKVTYGEYQTQALKYKIDGKAHTEILNVPRSETEEQIWKQGASIVATKFQQ